MSRFVNVTIWGWKDLGIIWGSVGHVMISEVDTNIVVLSQFPKHSYPRDDNTLHLYCETIGDEKRPSTVIYRVMIYDEESFDSAAKQHRDRPVWDWDPMPPYETHCARSAYDALRAGGVKIDPNNKYFVQDNQRNQILPNRLWHLIEMAHLEKEIDSIDIIQEPIEPNFSPDELVEYEKNIENMVAAINNQN